MGNSFSRRALDGMVAAGFWAVVAILAAAAPMTQPPAAQGIAAAVVTAETPAHVDTPGNGWGG